MSGRFWLLLCSALLATPQVRADDGEALVPPTLVEFIQAEYPSQAFEDGIEADVLLSIALDDEGLVTGVEVIEGAGQEFDEAAVDAAWQFVFQPAMLDGEPTASEVEFRYKFFVDEKVVEPEQEPDAPVTEEVPDEVEEHPDEVEPDYTTVVTGEKVADEQVVTHTLKTDEVLSMPGTSGDLLRAVQSMPGVARAPFGYGLLLIRGSAPDDSLILMDGHPIPMAFHLGGYSSVINAMLIEEIQYVPGNFSVLYGRATGGMINVKPKWFVPERWHAEGGYDAIDASALTYGPIGDKGYFAFSIRRSYADLFMKLIAKVNDTGGRVAAPTYWDYQLFFMYRPSPSDEIRLSIVGDSDWLTMVLSGETDDPAITNFRMRTMFHVAQLQWSHVFEAGLTYTASLQTGWIGNEFSIGYQMSTDDDSLIISHRQELRIPFGKHVDLTLGIDIQPWWTKARTAAPAATTDVLATASVMSDEQKGWFPEIAAFVEMRIRATDKFEIIPGVRLDWHGIINDLQLQPRLAARFSPWETTTFAFGVGIYSQTPTPMQISDKWGNPYLVAPRAVHWSLGVEQVISKAWLTISLTGFYKNLDRLVEVSDSYLEQDGHLVTENFDNDGHGRAYGLETMIRLEPGHFVYGWISYTLQRSERWDDVQRDWRMFDWDQTHVLSVLLGFELPKGFSVSLRFRAVTGTPQYTVEHSVFDADIGTYVGFWSDRPTRRAPTFHQLDLRADKKWSFRGGKGYLILYVDVQNVYNAKNGEYLLYNHDFTETGWIYGLPIIPSFGIRGGF